MLKRTIGYAQLVSNVRRVMVERKELWVTQFELGAGSRALEPDHRLHGAKARAGLWSPRSILSFSFRAIVNPL
jgi:hypothetical protein